MKHFVAVRPETSSFGAETESKLSGIFSALTSPAAVLLETTAAIGFALGDIGEHFETSFHQIQQQTGATGDSLEGLKDSFKDVFATTPGATFQNVADALDEVYRRTGLTGGALDDFTQKEIELGKITGTDVATNVAAQTGLLNEWGIAVGQQSSKLDELFKATQISGGSIADLDSTMATIAPRAQALGLNFDQTTALLANLGKAGIPAQAAFTGLGVEFAKAAKDGQDPLVVLQQLKESMLNASSPTEAAQIAIDKFGLGARQAFTLVTALRSGSLDFGATLAQITDGKGGINDTAFATLSLGDKLGLLKNRALVALQPLGEKVLDIANGIVDRIPAALDVAGDAFSSLWSVVGPIFDDLLGGFRDFVSGFTSGTDEIGSAQSTWAQWGATAYEAFLSVKQQIADLFNFYGPRLADMWHGLVDVWNSDVYPVLHDKILPVLQDVASWIGDHLTVVIGGLTIGLGLLFAPITTVAVGLLVLYERFAPFRTVVDDTGSALAKTASVLGEFASMIVDNKVATVVAIGAIAVAVSALLPPLAAMAFGLGVAVGPFIAIGAAVAGLAAVFVYAYNNFDGFRTVVDAVVSAVSSQIAVFVSFFEERWDRISVAARNVFTAFKVAFDAFVDVMRVAFVAFVAVTIGPFLVAWNYFGDQIQAVIGLAVTTVQSILSTFMRVLGDVFDFVTSLLAGDWGGAWDAFKDIPAAAVDLLLGTLGNLYNFLVDFFSTLPGNLISFLGDFGSMLADFAVSALEGLVSGLESGLAPVASWFVGLPGKIIGFVGSAASWLLGLGKTVLEGLISGLVAALPHVALFFATLPIRIAGFFFLANVWLAKEGEKIIGGLVTSLGGALSGVGNFFMDLPGKILGWLGDAGKWLVNEGPSALWGFLVGLGQAEINVLNWFKNLPGRILGWIGDLLSFLGPKAWDTITGFVTGLGAIEWKIIDWFKALPGKLLEWAGDATTWIKDKGGDMISGLVSGMESAVGSILNWFVGLPDKIKNGIVDFGTLIAGLGTDIVEGLIGGFDNAWHDILNWVKTKATDLVHLFTHPWEALSPSRVTYRLGTNIMEGLAFGMRDNVALVHAAIGALPGSEAFSPFANAARNVVLPSGASATISGGASGAAGAASTMAETNRLLALLLAAVKSNLAGVSLAVDARGSNPQEVAELTLQKAGWLLPDRTEGS